MDRRFRILLAAAVLCVSALFGCSAQNHDSDAVCEVASSYASSSQQVAVFDEISIDDIPDYSGEPYVVLNDGIPQFSESDFSMPYGTEIYGELDALGRCTSAFAVVGPETQSDERRGDIQSVKPSGWVQNLGLDGLDHLYERSHLIAYQLTAENDNERNLITGTNFMNQGTMQAWEREVARYVNGGGHVLMRVTPLFKDSELVCRGVQMQALSLEDAGESVCFNVFCYNVQPGVEIDYATGESREASEDEVDSDDLADTSGVDGLSIESLGGAAAVSSLSETGNSETAEMAYVLNTRSKKFHLPTCPSVSKMSPNNRQDVAMSRDEVISMGYSPCANCNP